MRRQPRHLSTRELSELLDELMEEGSEESTKFEKAHREWEKRMQTK